MSGPGKEGRVWGGWGVGSDRSASASLPGGTSLEASYTEAVVGRKRQTHPKVRIQPGGGAREVEAGDTDPLLMIGASSHLNLARHIG